MAQTQGATQPNVANSTNSGYNQPNERFSGAPEAGVRGTIFDSSVVAKFYGGGTMPGAYSLFVSVCEKSLEQLEGRIGNLERAVANGDFPSITHYAHQLKGTYSMTGAPQLGELCRQIELLGRKADLTMVRKFYAEVRDLNEQYKNELSCYISGICSAKDDL